MARCSGVIAPSRSKNRRMFWKPTGASRSTPSGAAKIQVAFGADLGSSEGDFKGGGHRVQGDTGAGNECLQQHVAGAGVKAGSAGGGMEAGFDQCSASCHRTGDAFADGAFGLEGNDGGLRSFTVAGFERGLEGFQFITVHLTTPLENPH